LGGWKFSFIRNLKNINRENNICRSSNKIEEKYANYVKVGHHPFEFGLNFGQYYSGIDKAELYSGIIASTSCAAKLSHAELFIS
jgi:hypothetical protein